MCGPNSKVKESREPTIELKDDDPKAVEAVLRHLYNFTYAETEKAAGDFTTETHLHIITAAQKYMLPALETHALEALDSAVTKTDEACKKSKQALPVLELLKLLSNHSELHKRVVEQSTRLIENNFVHLFKLVEFRKLLETTAWSQALDKCINIVETGKGTGPPKQQFIICTSCNMVWLANRGVSFCPACHSSSSSKRSYSFR